MSEGLCQYTGCCWQDPGCALHGSGVCPALTDMPADIRERITRKFREQGTLTLHDTLLVRECLP